MSSFSSSLRRSIHGAWIIATIACAPAAAAQGMSTKVECASLKLESATGVPDQPTRQYRFSGSCALYHQSSISALSGQAAKPFHTFPVTALGAWDATKNQFQETVTILGQFSYLGKPISGSVTSTFACSYDPVTSQTACNGTSHSNATQLSGFSKPYESHTPILAGRATMAQATAVAAPSGKLKQPPRQTLSSAAPAIKEAMQSGTDDTPTRATPPQRSAPAAPDGCAGVGEIALTAGARIVLENGRLLAADDAEGAWRWAILAADGEVLRRFPAESRAYRFPGREIAVDWGGGVFRAGRERQARLKLPSG